MNDFFDKTKNFLASERFFWLVMCLFAFQAVWLVLSAVYPMAFDEAYHFNLIKIYAEEWLPFFIERPDGMGFNAITRYPSYFFHYIMSFPYRLIAAIAPYEFAHIIFLRLLNVGLFGAGLVMFRKILLRSGLSKGLSNLSILLFTLIPIVPLLAAHINYDNLLFLLVAWMLLCSARIIEGLQARSIALKPVLVLIIIGLLTSVVKYAALPLLLAIFGFLAVYGYLKLRKATFSETKKGLVQDWRSLTRVARATLIAALLISGGLFIERYGVNLVRYQALVPACDSVLSVEECMDFEPFARNQAYAERRDPNFQPNRAEHAQRWFGGMWYRTFFMINGDVEINRYQNFAPLPLPALAATAVLLLGVVAVIRHWRYIFENRPLLVLLIVMSLFYAAILYARNYSGYISHGRTAALNGRYLILVYPAIIAVIGLGLQRLLRGLTKTKVIAATLVLLLFLQGGGLISFIVRSNDSWYWPHPNIVNLNLRTQELVAPVIFGSDQEHLRDVPH